MADSKIRAAIFMANGFEEVEAITIIDILRRAEIETEIVSVTDKIEVTSSHGVRLVCDSIFASAANAIESAEVLILPGGPGTSDLKTHKALGEALIRANESGKLLAAICAAPSVFGKYGILNGRIAVCYPGYEGELCGAEISKEAVVVSDNVITGMAAGRAHDFAFKIVELLSEKSGVCGAEAASMVRSKMFYQA